MKTLPPSPVIACGTPLGLLVLPLLVFLLFALLKLPASAEDITVDNTSSGATLTGTWTASTNVAGYYGSNYIHDGATAKGNKSVLYTPNLPRYGQYEVLARWTADSQRAPSVPFTINSTTGSTTVYANEQVNGTRWNSLGVYSFNAGTGGSVQLSNAGTTGYVIADALRFAEVVPGQALLDNNSPLGVTLTGTWTTSTTTPGYYGANYIHDNATGKGSRSVRYTPTLNLPGKYEVFARWTADGVRSNNVPVTINSASGASTVYINEQINGDQWNSLGTYSFNAGTAGNVLISNANTSNYVVADAIKFVPVLWTPADLGDQVWLDWRAEDLPDGPVSSWASRVGGVTATQSNSSYYPTKQNGEVYFANTKTLSFPRQDLANVAHRGVMILFRIDLTGSGDGCIFSVNGVGGGYERQPIISYDRGTNKVSVGWKTPNGYNSISFTLAENASQWHCLVSRRVGTIHYASLDGKKTDGTPGESQVDLADWAVPRVNASVTGYLGDFRTSTPVIGIDTVLVLQDELLQSDAEKLMGWGMWRRNIQDQLPASHPYRNQPPVSSDPSYVFTESSQAEYDAFKAYWQDTTQSEAFKGMNINLTGWNLVFQDEFDQHTVTNDVTGRGNWFAPTHGAACGAATAVVPAYNSTDPAIGTQGTPATYIQDASTMTIRMQNSGGWKSGSFCSVNSNGIGRAWMYPYIEARMKIGASSTGNLKGAWPALWVKSINSFYNLSESYLEYDCYEGYISDPQGFHNSYHNWPASRLVPGRLTAHRWLSNYLGLKTSTGGWYQNVNLFDGLYHTYGVMVTPDYVINMFDGKEAFRVPTPVEMKQPLWILLDLAMNTNGEVSQASGIYELTIDYVKVYQNPSYPGYQGN